MPKATFLAVNTAPEFKVMTCSITMHLPLREVENALELLQSVRVRVQVKPGCLLSLVTRNANDADCLYYTEKWESEAAFRRHVQSDDFQRVLIAMDLCREEPQIVVGKLLGHSGIEYLRQLRETPGAKVQ
jgi:quinol monooxygenase YgiN